jgi:hypothetical protein
MKIYREVVWKDFKILKYAYPNGTPMDKNLTFITNMKSDLVDGHEYRPLVGSLSYVINTWLDTFYAISRTSQFMEDP